MIKIIVTTKDELQEIIQASVKSAISEQTIQLHEERDKIMSLQEASAFLNLAQQTVYGFTSKQQIPFIKKGKKLYFRKSELEAWLMKGR
jgi:excisionase family DNA binding protein